jgi:Bacterial Ig-like domain (group 3)
VRSSPLINFPTPTVVGTLDATDDPETLTVQESGNIPSSLVAGTDPAFSGTNPTAFLLANTGTCPSLTPGEPVTAADTFSLGEICTYTLNFDPTVVGPNTANLVLSTATAGGALTSASSISLYGIGLSTLNHFTLVAISNPATTPTTVNLGGSVELVLTAIQSDGAVATDYTGTITFTTTDTNGLYKGGTGANSNTTTYTMTSADNGVLILPVPSGLQLNQYGVFTATAVADPASVPPGANGTAVSNNIYVVQPSTLTLTSSVNPSLVNQTTVFTLTITTTGANAPAGTVSFYNGATLIGTETVTPPSASTGTASIPASFPADGSYPISAVYTSTSNTAGGTATLTQVVGYTPTVSLTSSVNPVFLDNPTLLTATLTPAAAGTAPTGTITFFDGSTPIGSGTLVNGAVSVTASFVYAGTHSLTAVYSGDAADAPGTSPVYLQTVADFSLAVASGGSATGSTLAGGTFTYPLVVTPIITTTLPGPITLTVSGLPTTVTGTLTPAAIATGFGTTPVAFAVTAAPLSLTSRVQPNPSRLTYAPITLALLALPLAWFRRRKRFASLVASICLLLAITAGFSGCVSAPDTGYYGQTPQTYNLTVTATSGNLSRSTYLTLTVQ